MTVADWAACAVTFGWAATAFWVVHVITRPRPEARRDASAGEQPDDRR
jgi:hypothetical protein